MEKIAAFFDIDGTIINGTSEEILLIFLLLKKKINPFKFLAFFILFLFYKLNTSGEVLKMREKAAKFLKNWNAAITKNLFHDCFEKKIKPKLIPETIQLIENHRRKGHLIILVSASFDFVVENYRQYLKPDFVIATKLEIQNNCFSGKISSLISYGVNKARLIEELSKKHSINLKESYAYANHISDLPFLEMAGRPCVINPDKVLKNAAEKNDWKVYNFKK